MHQYEKDVGEGNNANVEPDTVEENQQKAGKGGFTEIAGIKNKKQEPAYRIQQQDNEQPLKKNGYVNRDFKHPGKIKKLKLAGVKNKKSRIKCSSSY